MVRCILCGVVAQSDPADRMACGACNAHAMVACNWFGKRCHTHDGRQQVALFYGFTQRCRARKGREPCLMRELFGPWPQTQGELLGAPG